MLFSLLKHHLDLNITDTALKVYQSLYCFTTSISHGVENYFPRLWGTDISDFIFVNRKHSCLLHGDSIFSHEVRFSKFTDVLSSGQGRG